MVEPEREIPGMMATHWAAPTASAAFQPVVFAGTDPVGEKKNNAVDQKRDSNGKQRRVQRFQLVLKGINNEQRQQRYK